MEPTLRVTAHSLQYNSGTVYCVLKVKLSNTVHILTTTNIYLWGSNPDDGEEAESKIVRAVTSRGSLLLTDHNLHSPSTAMQHIPIRIFSLAITLGMFCKLRVLCASRGQEMKEGCAIYSDTVQRAVRYTLTLCRGLCDIQ